MQRYLLGLGLASQLAFAQSPAADSLAKSNIYQSKPHYSQSQLFVPGALMLGGLVINETEKRKFQTHIAEKEKSSFHAEDYLQYTPHIMIFGLDYLGMKARTPINDRLYIFAKGHLMMGGLTLLLKNTTKVMRPDGSAANSFPSGHTGLAFAGATMLATEYQDEYPWMPYLAYGIASAVGGLRMVHNRHYINDVLFGAGLGIFSVKLAYWTHSYDQRNIFKLKDPFQGVIYE
jgi:membrane-associated phospholipid phosphatase